MASIYKRGRIWWFKMQHRGRLIRESLETSTERVARERAREFEKDIREGRWTDSKRTFSDAVEAYLELGMPKLKPSSRRRYVSSLMQLAPYFEFTRLTDFNNEALMRYEQARRAGGASNGTIRRDLSALSAVLRLAKRLKWVKENVAKEYLSEAAEDGLVEAPPRTRYLSHEEEARLLKVLDDRVRQAEAQRKGGMRNLHGAIMMRAAVILTLEEGFRLEELMSLTWDNVDLESEQPQIRIIGDVAKNHKERSVPLMPRAIEVLRSLPRSDQCRYVLWHVGRDREPTRYTDFKSAFIRLLDKVAIKDFSWHDLRRTCACRLLQDRKLRIEHVSLWLGHSTIEQTRRAYAFLDVRHLHEALASGHKSRHIPALDQRIQELSL